MKQGIIIEWIEDMRKKRKMINDWDVSYIQSIVRLAATQSKKTLVYWAIDYSRKIMLPIWTKYYPNDLRPQEALNAAYDWIYGKIKLPEAKIAMTANDGWNSSC